MSHTPAPTVGDDAIGAHTGPEAIDALAGNDTINGIGAGDTIYGGDGNDTMYIGGGATLAGGAGDDRYLRILPQPRVPELDTIVEQPGGGTDWMEVSGYGGTVFMPDNVEGLILAATLFSSPPTHAVGNTLDNVMYASNMTNDTLEGGAGNDTLKGDYYAGYQGNSPYHENAGSDVLHGGDGNDVLWGDQAGMGVSLGIANDTLYGDAGNDTLYGESGTDALYGGAGNDRLDGGSDNDSLYGGSGNDTLIGGNGSDDYYEGGAGDDVIEPGTGTDNMSFYAGDGHDIVRGLPPADSESTQLSIDFAHYYAFTAGAPVRGLLASEVAFTRSGEDLVMTVKTNGESVTVEGWFTPDANGLYPQLQLSLLDAYWSNAEILAAVQADGGDGGGGSPGTTGTEAADTLTGTAGHDDLWGRGGDDLLQGGDGNDFVNGELGNDTLVGGTGDDMLIVDSTGDVVTELAGEGNDTVQSYIDYTLGANVENLILIGDIARTGTGNAAANMLTGNLLANLLDGGLGADTIDGGGGADTLLGGRGADVLVVRSGLEHVDGGAGSDVLRIDAALAAWNVGALANGTIAGIETIDLRNGAATQLRLDTDAVLAGSPDGTWRIQGEAGDRLVLDGGWSMKNERDGYVRYVHDGADGHAVLLVGTAVAVEMPAA